jgi:hypothetical protein
MVVRGRRFGLVASGIGHVAVAAISDTEVETGKPTVKSELRRVVNHGQEGSPALQLFF